LKEFSGSLGDLGLFIPLVVAVSLTSGMNLGVIFIAAGLMNILTGYFFAQPIPVQPMKAIAAVVITEGLTQGGVVAAGLGMALLLIFLSYSGGIELLRRFIPNALVRGIQLGVGLKLALKGYQWIANLPILGTNSIILAVIIGLLLLYFIAKKIPGLLFVFLGGFALVYWEHPELFNHLSFIFPSIHLVIPSSTEWNTGLVQGTLPQLPLTLLNSVIAVCALSADYFPNRGIKTQRMAASVGWMNLICVPFGAIPMCHGAGGLAAQYGFGARTGGSVIMLGGIKLLLGLFVGGFLLQILKFYPYAILAPMLVFAGIELARTSFSLKNKTDISVAILTAMGILGGNTLIGFLLGGGMALIVFLWGKTNKTE